METPERDTAGPTAKAPVEKDGLGKRPDEAIACPVNGGTNNGQGAPVASLARVEWEHIQRVLADCVGNKSRAAKLLGLQRRSLQRKLARKPPL